MPYESVNLTANDQIQTVTESYYIHNGSNVEFVLTDTHGDGIFNGGYEIYVCQESLTGFVAMTDVYSSSEEFMAVCGDILGCMDRISIKL